MDIITEVSMLASQIALPREGHLEVLFHIYAYLKIKHKSRMAFDPTYPDIDMIVFKECNWNTFYGDVKEAVPANAPSKEIDLRMFADSNHAE